MIHHPFFLIIIQSIQSIYRAFTEHIFISKKEKLIFDNNNKYISQHNDIYILLQLIQNIITINLSLIQCFKFQNILKKSVKQWE